jgi:hypothetical protein
MAKLMTRLLLHCELAKKCWGLGSHSGCVEHKAA